MAMNGSAHRADADTDVIVVGAGHKGLVAACYLAPGRAERAGAVGAREDRRVLPDHLAARAAHIPTRHDGCAHYRVALALGGRLTHKRHSAARTDDLDIRVPTHMVGSLEDISRGFTDAGNAAIPAMVEQDRGGSIVITSSAAGLKGTTRSLRTKTYGMLGYTAAKHGVVGLIRAYANALGSYRIRVNSIHPTGADTPVVNNDAFLGAAPQVPELFEAMTNILPVPLIEAQDMANAVAWLVSDGPRYITGATIPIDAGATAR